MVISIVCSIMLKGFTAIWDIFVVEFVTVSAEGPLQRTPIMG